MSAQVEPPPPPSSQSALCARAVTTSLSPPPPAYSDLSWPRGVSWAVWERMRPNGGVTLEPAVRPDMGRVEGCKVTSGGQVEAGTHR